MIDSILDFLVNVAAYIIVAFISVGGIGLCLLVFYAIGRYIWLEIKGEGWRNEGDSYKTMGIK